MLSRCCRVSFLFFTSFGAVSRNGKRNIETGQFETNVMNRKREIDYFRSERECLSVIVCACVLIHSLAFFHLLLDTWKCEQDIGSVIISFMF